MHDSLYGFFFSISDWVGITGVIMLLTAYLLLNMGRWTSDSLAYQLMNFMSSWLILFSLMFHWNLSSVLIEIAWIIISIIGIYRKVIRKSNNPVSI